MLLRKILLAILIIGMEAFLVGGATTAYFFDEKPLVTSPEFQMGTVGINVERMAPDQENLIDLAQNNAKSLAWQITNTGSEETRLRIKVMENLMEGSPLDKVEDGEGLENISEPGSIKQIVSGDWQKAADGFYYYNKVLKKEKTIPFNLLLDIEGNISGQYDLAIEVQALQAANTGEIWPKLH